MATPVLIVVQSDDIVPVLLESVVVDVYDAGGSFVTTNTTDVNGEAPFALDDADYDLLFFKRGISVLPRQPQRITVDVGAVTNTFDVIASVFSLPTTSNPTLCKVSGTLITATGAPAPLARITLGPLVDPIVLDPDSVYPCDVVNVVTDSDGYASFDLIRNIEYSAFLDGSATEHTLVIPDSNSILLSTLLYPLPVLATMSQTTLALVAGGDVDSSTTYTITYSDGSVRSSSQWASIGISSSDELVATVTIQDGTILVTPLATGVANVTLTRTIASTGYWSNVPSFATDTLVVTVT